LCEPARPDIKGIDGFTGEVFHSARWNHEVDLTGKRVRLIGMRGPRHPARAEIAKTVGGWTSTSAPPRGSCPVATAPTPSCSALRTSTFPAAAAGPHRDLLGRETFVFGFAINPRLAAPARKMRWPTSRARARPGTAACVTPNFQIGLQAHPDLNDWYPMLSAERVAREDGIANPRNTIVSTDGTNARSMPSSWQPASTSLIRRPRQDQGRRRAHARRGLALGRQHLQGGGAAGSRTCSSSSGPNTGLGHNSMVLMIESS